MIYREEFIPRIEDYTQNGILSLEAILRIFENAGCHHSDSVDDGVIEGSLKGTSWILTQWRVRIFVRPMHGERLSAATWAVNMSRPGSITVRNYAIYNADGSLCVCGAAKLVLMDMNTGRLLRITPELLEKYKPEETDIFEDTLPRMQEPETFEYEKNIVLRRSDIDFNNHVHNTCYLNFALETLPDEVYKADDFSHINIAYKNPVKANEDIVCKYSACNGKYTVAVYGSDNELKSLVEFIK